MMQPARRTGCSSTAKCCYSGHLLQPSSLTSNRSGVHASWRVQQYCYRRIWTPHYSTAAIASNTFNIAYAANFAATAIPSATRTSDYAAQTSPSCKLKEPSRLIMLMTSGGRKDPKFARNCEPKADKKRQSHCPESTLRLKVCKTRHRLATTDVTRLVTHSTTPNLVLWNRSAFRAAVRPLEIGELRR